MHSATKTVDADLASSPVASATARSQHAARVLRDGAEDDPGDVVLLLNTWFSRKRTGEEFPRAVHAALVGALLAVIILLRQNSVQWNGDRCSAGCFRWQCGDKTGAVNDGWFQAGSCSQFEAHIRTCRAFSILQMITLGMALVLQVTELVRPGMLTVKYRFLMTWLLIISGVFLFVWVMTVIGVWTRQICGTRLSDGWHLGWGWSFSLINSVLLVVVAWYIWKGRRP
eukprot:TRINITY_DN13290_c0_g1_i1.p1 TRINITY_DN13290_c0_g1~~TRINITY_DN13290_c0_g1_i1.p1  ORF type:complete len:244 (+),score=56.51 TRINITY_DN13290_c0_g1_i1:53-733(+)